ncbi:MAG: thioredoxin family protein [Ktedonobacteraceae bacterium]
MALISPEDQQTVRELFAQKLQNDIDIIYFTQRESVLPTPAQECETCKDTRELLEEVTALSEKIHLTVKDFVSDEQEAQRMGIERIPAFVLKGRARGVVRFFGIPAGYEFSTLIEDIVDVSQGATKLSEKTREALAKVDQDLHIQVFVTPT